MEGNPYNASSEHLVKLRKKLQIIRPWFLILFAVKYLL
jgi:hypothetical protein